jgi:hypothetical protein
MEEQDAVHEEEEADDDGEARQVPLDGPNA